MTSFDPNQPFNSLPPLPPPVDLQTPQILKAAIAASRVLAELRGLGSVLPDQKAVVS